MKVPWYETSGGATEALLLTSVWVDCDLYTLTSAGGGIVIRYATGVYNVSVSSVIYTADQVRVDLSDTNGRGHWKAGTGVDVWQVSMAPRAYDIDTNTANPDLINGLPWLEAIRRGVFDGGDIQVDRAIFSTWPTSPPGIGVYAFPTGVFTLFKGMLGGVDVGRSQAAFTSNSYMDLLTNNSPRNLFQSSCRFTLFDTGCALSAASYAITGTCGGATTQNLVATALTPAAGLTFALGRVVVTSGQNAGFMRPIKTWNSGVSLVLAAPFFYPLNPGDSFTAYPGCDKSMTACTAYGNLLNFGGQPFIPVATTAL